MGRAGYTLNAQEMEPVICLMMLALQPRGRKPSSPSSSLGDEEGAQKGPGA